jgi:hypothetical protein
MITPVIVKKEKDGIYIVNDDKYQIAFITTDNKLFIEQSNAIQHERKLMNDADNDDKSVA